ncbi:MAG: heavy metal sensor kinase [Candidatus Omnitrophota bacterium]|jgi:heavy metal sensor kinase
MKFNIFSSFSHAKVRLSLWNAIFLFLVIVIVLSYIYSSMKTHLFNETRRYIHHEIQELVTFIEERGVVDRTLAHIRNELSINEEYSHAFTIFDAEGHFIQPADFEGAHFIDQADIVEFLKDAPQSTYFKDIKINSETKTLPQMLAAGRAYNQASGQVCYLVVQTDASSVVMELELYQRRLLMLLPPILLFVIFCAWVLAGLVLKPVQKMATVFEEISVQNFDKKAPITGSGDEFDRLAESFNRMLTRIRESYDRIAQFTSDASHELNTPVTVMRNEVDVILSKKRSLEEYSDALYSQQEELDRLSRLIQSMLWIARADSKRLQTNFIAISLEDILRDVTDSYEPVAAAKSIHIELKLKPISHIQGDTPQLKQLFANLIDNAIKYNRENGHIWVNLDEDNEHVIASIRDEGPGVPAIDQEKIFDRFYRVRESVETGHGLGLSIACAIAKIHDAKIEVQTTQTVGAVFLVKFPK